jgi:glycosyltransferase involved in cell wall biosynthesis
VPLRVAIDATSLLEPLTGVGVFVDELLGHVGSRDDLCVTAFAITWRGRGLLPAATPDGVRALTRVLPATPLRRAWAHTDHPRVDAVIGRHDVVHGPNFLVPPTRAAAVVSVHDLTPWRHPELCDDNTRQYPTLVRRAAARGAWIHVDSEFVRDEILSIAGPQLPVAPERVVTVPLGVRPVGPGDSDVGHRVAGGERYILALGTIEPRKDLPTLVRAFDALAASDPDLRLVIAGKDGPGAGALDAAVAVARHGNRVVRVGYVDDSTRIALLRGATAYAYPSLYEGFGLPPLEAMTAGVPVVATAVGSLPEVLGDGALLVPARDADALAGALERVATDGQLRDELSARGRAVATGWTWERCAAGMARLYSLAAGAASTAP